VADDELRIREHPLSSAVGSPATVQITIDGRPIAARDGEPIAAALWAQGTRALRTMAGSGAPRGYFCGVGRCAGCVMLVDGQPNVRTCITPVHEGMLVETQHGLGFGKATA
jgi:aerobic-type carbon monoxide dehydrogenase small subunit (CoxS/CutS family)